MSANNVSSISRFSSNTEERKFNQIAYMLRSQIKSQKFNPSTVVKRMQNYGCYCFSNNSKQAGGKGAPQDDYDKICRDLARCQKCIQMDFVIDPYETRYKWSVDSETGEIFCDHRRNSEFQKSLCECDSKFAMDMGMAGLAKGNG